MLGFAFELERERDGVGALIEVRYLVSEKRCVRVSIQATCVSDMGIPDLVSSTKVWK